MGLNLHPGTPKTRRLIAAIAQWEVKSVSSDLRFPNQINNKYAVLIFFCCCHLRAAKQAVFSIPPSTSPWLGLAKWNILTSKQPFIWLEQAGDQSALSLSLSRMITCLQNAKVPPSHNDVFQVDCRLQWMHALSPWLPFIVCIYRSSDLLPSMQLVNKPAWWMALRERVCVCAHRAVIPGVKRVKRGACSLKMFSAPFPSLLHSGCQL